DIEKNHVIRRVLQQKHGFACRGRAGHTITLFAQDLFQRVADLRFVIHHKDVIHQGSPFTTVSVLPSKAGALSTIAAPASSSGKRTRKRAPFGLLDSARTEPLCSCTILAAMESPSPVPRCLVEE